MHCGGGSESAAEKRRVRERETHCVLRMFRKSYEPQIYINDWSHLAGILKSYSVCVFIANAYVVWSIAEHFIQSIHHTHKQFPYTCLPKFRSRCKQRTDDRIEREKNNNSMQRVVWVRERERDRWSEAYWMQANFVQKPDAYHNLNVRIELWPSPISHPLHISHTPFSVRRALFRSQNTGNIINEIKFNLTWKCKHKFFNRIILMDVDK